MHPRNATQCTHSLSPVQRLGCLGSAHVFLVLAVNDHARGFSHVALLCIIHGSVLAHSELAGHGPKTSLGWHSVICSPYWEESCRRVKWRWDERLLMAHILTI